MSHPRLPFLDSFDHELTPISTRKWTVSRGVLVAGRHGNGVQLGVGNYCETYFCDDVHTMAAGCAYRTSAFANYPLAFWSGGESTAGTLTPMVSLMHLGDGRLYVRAAGIGSAAVDSPPTDFVMQLNQWYYLELKAFTYGGIVNPIFAVDYEVYVNEEKVLEGTLAGVSWRVDHGHMNGLKITGPGGGLTATVDDVYCNDGTILGDIRIGVIRPNGEGTHQDWTPDSGGVHYSRVNELTPDDDTGYLKATAIGEKETHEYEDISVSGSIKCIQTLVCQKKSDAGSASTKSLLRNGAGAEVSGEIFYPSEGSWFYGRTGYLLSPFTGVAFTEAEINALQFGLERTL